MRFWFSFFLLYEIIFHFCLVATSKPRKAILKALLGLQNKISNEEITFFFKAEISSFMKTS